MGKEKITERFYCGPYGTIYEKVGNKKDKFKDNSIADFFGGCPEVWEQLFIETQEKRDRIIHLLNLGYREEQKQCPV